MNEKQIFHINKRSFITIIVVLSALIIFSIILAFTLQQGVYSDGTYIPKTEKVNLLKLIFSPILVLGSPVATTIIVISSFIIILGGSFNLMDKTGGIESILNYFVKRFSDKKIILMHIIVLLFMSLGAFFGIFEEAVTLMPMVILLSLSLGWDTFTGMGMSLIAVGFGFSSAVTNPFTIGLGSIEMGLLVTEGIFFRLGVFIILYIVLCLYLRMHIKKIEKNPRSSFTYDIDEEKRTNLQELELIENPQALKVYSFFFLGQLLLMLVVSSIKSISVLMIPLLTVGFLVGSFISAKILKHNNKFIIKKFWDGAKSMLPAIILILLASSIKFILDESFVMDTIIYRLSNMFSSQTKFSAVLFIYALILVVQFFIGSATAKIPLLIPILSEFVAQVGITPNIALLAFIFGDGFTDLIYPTNPVLLIALGLAGVSYIKWLKKTWKLQLFLLLLTCLILYLAYIISY